jgi:hypothetical protein
MSTPLFGRDVTATIEKLIGLLLWLGLECFFLCVHRATVLSGNIDGVPDSLLMELSPGIFGVQGRRWIVSWERHCW